jgi:hypothetical protein
VYNAAGIETDRSGRISRDAYTHLWRHPYGLTLGPIALPPLATIGSIVIMAIFSSCINPTEGTSRFMCTVAFK